MAEKVVSLETYLKQLPRLNLKMNNNIFYRGQSKLDYKLTPSVLRDNMQCKEHEIYNEIMIECAHEFADCELHNEILSKMQHYGVPTRLLDVTTNPLVALYFACCSNQNVDDGVVYIIKKDKSEIKQYDSDVISILSSLPRFNLGEKEEILQLAQDIDATIKKFNAKKIIKRLLHEIKKEKPAFENIINPKDLLENFVFVPRKANARIIRQSGAFIIFGLLQNEIKIDETCSDDNLTNNISYKIIINKDAKTEIVEQLSCFGISKATLHPELYKVAEYIKERYR